MTEKIIHFLWLNFNNKSDGVLDETLLFFKNRIEQLHPIKNGWTINFISSWKTCLETITGEDWLKELLNNDYVGPAHKSDALRYYYLNKRGGVWIDISTFLVSSLDDLVSQNNKGFTCYYMPSDVCATWLIKLSSDIFESITMKEYKEKVFPKQTKLLNIKNINFNFITENYFLISSKGNEVCAEVLNNLKLFWTEVLSKIVSKQAYCFELNKLMYSLFKKTYNIKINRFPYLELVESFSGESESEIVKEIILKEYFDCAYFFNYLQLYLAIRNYSMKHNGILVDLPNSTKKIETITLEELSTFSKELCDNNSCNNKVIKFINESNNIYLLSASYNRLSKWNDSRTKRISWENTLAGNILNNISYTSDDVLRMLEEIDIKQLKYSSYTRTRSNSINRLKELFSKSTNPKGGSKRLLLNNGKNNKTKQKQITSKKTEVVVKPNAKKYIGPRGGVYFIKGFKKVYI
jgi:hypothetical protein